MTSLLPSSADEFAEACDVGVQWSPGAPQPLVIADGWRLNVVVRLTEGIDPAPAGLTPRPEPFGIIVFDKTYKFVFGPPGDEDLARHRLFGRGLDFYAAHTVLRSAWAAAEGRPEMTHFVLTFHDETLECLAATVSSVRRIGTLAEVMQHVADWMS